MNCINFVLTAARVISTFVGLVVLLMCLLGILGLADFQLVFVVPEKADQIPARPAVWVTEIV